ncbi:MAG: zf-HC2 domain-containing protein [Kiritimatiellae bacterium]|nr:zf-HC2 domain-containing protein [Kiritimatiellia bacterium]
MNEERSDTKSGNGSEPEPLRLRCSEIQVLLFDYLSRELGPHRSDLVREHLRKCEVCRNAAAELQSTVDALRMLTENETTAPCRLSDERRASILWSVMHPFLDWVYRHHVICAVIITTIILVLMAMLLRYVGVWSGETPEPTPTVTIGTTQGEDGIDGTRNGNGAKPHER